MAVILTGAKSAKRMFDKVSREAANHLERAVTAGALVVQNEAKQKAPVRTGNLRRSIHTETTRKRVTSVTVATGTDAEYARRIEFGFSDTDSLGRSYNQPAQPYLRPAFDENRDEVMAEIEAAFDDIIRRAAR